MLKIDCIRVDHVLTVSDLLELPDGIYTQQCTFEQWLESLDHPSMPVLYSILLHRGQEAIRQVRIV